MARSGLLSYTERSIALIRFAEMEAEKTTGIVYPIHLLLGLLKIRTETVAELYINYPNLPDILYDEVKKTKFDKGESGISYQPFFIPISETTKLVMEKAKERMNHYGQVYLNEGYIIEAICKVDECLTKAMLRRVDIDQILHSVAYPRDMIVSLRDYSFPAISVSKIILKKAKRSDAVELKSFVKGEFGEGWLTAIENGLSQDNIPIYLAWEDKQIMGFACYDVVRKKKGLFGPMGISLLNRIQGIGYALLHYSLYEMKAKGYEYAVIGEAGPLEFYEKACNAVVIPKKLKVTSFSNHN